jgi:hypothetical protein
MGERLNDIKQTTADALQIIKELRSPELQGSLEKVRLMSSNAKEIMELLSDPNMVKNIENIRLTAEAFHSMSLKIENIVLEVKKIGMIEQARDVIKSPSSVLSSSNTMLTDIIKAITEMPQSLRELVDELKLTISGSRKFGVIKIANETLQNTSNAYENIREELKHTDKNNTN